VRVKQLVEKSDFEREIATADVEKRVRELSERMAGAARAPARRAKAHGVDVADIGGVELFGGASRFTPFQNAAAAGCAARRPQGRPPSQHRAVGGAGRGASRRRHCQSERRASRQLYTKQPCGCTRARAPASCRVRSPPTAPSSSAIRAHLAAAAELDRTLLQRSEARATLEKYLIAAGEALDKMEEAGVDVDAGRAAVRAQRDFLDMEADELTTVEQFTERLDSRRRRR
jgi:hypothetical protein